MTACIQGGLDEVKEQQEVIREYVAVIAEVAATLEPGTADVTERQEQFEALIDQFEATEDPIRHGMATVMLSFLAGLFVGEEDYEGIRDNLELERWFRLPKSHERRIHGRRHAGVRLVQTGATLVPALDAHAAHPGPFTADDLMPYRGAREPPCQTQALDRRKVMRKAALEEATASSACRSGAALSGIAVILALLRIVVIKWRWVVERTFAWLGRYRRNSRDYEKLSQHK